MKNLEVIDRHIQENLSAGNLSKDEVLLVKKLVEEFSAAI